MTRKTRERIEELERLVQTLHRRVRVLELKTPELEGEDTRLRYGYELNRKRMDRFVDTLEHAMAQFRAGPLAENKAE